MKLIVFLLVLLVGTSVHAAGQARPNIVFIIADDLGYTDLGCYGSGYYETPRIDRMAAEGVRFTDGYSCGPNCQPTRAALITGQYAARTGVYTVGSIDRFDWRSRPLRPVDNVTALPLDKVTIAQALKQAGYATGMFGKWHLGNDSQHHPASRGFDEAIESSGKHFGFQTDPPTEHADDEYLADFLTDRAVDFMERHQKEPFFLYIPHFGVHAPHEAKEELVAKFKAKPPKNGHRNPTYAAMIASVDESVGRVLDKLDERNLAENTLVIFTSDNGGVGSYRSIGLSKEGITSNAPLRGGKGTLYEGGIRVPYVFRWKGHIEPGRTVATPINSVDLFPTLLQATGAEPPAGQKLDGASYWDLLVGNESTLDRDALYWHFPGYLGAGPGEWRTRPVSVIRAGSWKLIESLEDGSRELYNLETDISEQNNLAAEETARADALHAQLAGWRDAVKAKMPTENSAVSADDAPKKKGQKNRRKGRRARREGRTG